jgi:hypothetical protein
MIRAGSLTKGADPVKKCPGWVISDGGKAASKPGHVRYAAEAEVSSDH